MDPVIKPNCVRCVVCGRDKYTNPEVLKKRIEKFGSEENMRKEYTCRDCKKDKKRGDDNKSPVEKEESDSEEIIEEIKI